MLIICSADGVETIYFACNVKETIVSYYLCLSKKYFAHLTSNLI
jgi:hypothetical protein